MPRKPLGLISPNIIRRKELTPYRRGIIGGRAAAGLIVVKIARELDLPRRIVRSIIERGAEHDKGTTKPRSGRPKLYNARDERTIIRLARVNPKQTYVELIEKSGVGCSKKIIYRILSHPGITNWIAKKRPLLRP